MPGPPPTPTRVLEQRGSWRAKARPAEPRLKPKAPKCPRHLTGEVAKVYRELGRQLAREKIVAEIDGLLLELLANGVVRYRNAIAWLADAGEAVSRVSAEGDLIWSMSPAHNAIKELEKSIVRLADRFGLSPAARARLVGGGSAGAAQNEDEELAFRLLRDPRGRKPGSLSA